jgi:sulfur carrier protein ThiS
MKIKVKILPRNVLEEVEVAKGATVSELLKKIHLGPGAFVVLKNNIRIPVEYILDDDQDLCIMRVTSGG